MTVYKIYRILLGEEPVHYSDEKITDFPSAGELLEKKPKPGIVLIDGIKGNKTSDMLKVFWELVIDPQSSGSRPSTHQGR